MKKTAGVLAVLMTACGPSVGGRVSGYALDVNEALFSTVTDSRGATVGAVLVLSDQRGVCAQLAAPKAPPNAMFTMFALTRRADQTPLSPDVGEYVVGATTAASASASGVFIRTDGNGTNSIPAANRGATSGLVRVTELSLDRGVMGVQIDAKFGVQADAIGGGLRADRCIIDSMALMRGFLFTGDGTLPGGGGGGGTVYQSPECADMLACYAAFNAGSTSSLIDSYGASGTCWRSTAAAASACTDACRQTLTSLRSSPGAPSACFR